ncbi:uncharacterized protein LOC109860738 [Pseudomyrmex gracilis]|uniref:uncharacterized protein LOC109860738 n=1 Tax=Pseudomyrmex gracilis TaxID=219809 RepID=UPI000994A3D2|nr:uncharacterized protein LOC109860738 [Pseudomyrmex gracilis]
MAPETVCRNAAIRKHALCAAKAVNTQTQRTQQSHQNSPKPYLTENTDGYGFGLAVGDKIATNNNQIAEYIGGRLDKINDHIVQLSEIENYDLRCMSKTSISVNRRYIRRTEYRKRMLWIAMHLHLELCHVARNINALNGVRMTIQMASYFVTFTKYVFLQYHVLVCLSHETGLIKWYFLISSILWTILLLIKLLTINHICESVSAKAERTKIVIHKLTNLIRFADAYDEIYQFGLQISLHPLKFTGLGLFYFGYTFIRSFAVWVFTIVLLLVQVDTFVVNTFSKINVEMCFQ